MKPKTHDKFPHLIAVAIFVILVSAFATGVIAGNAPAKEQLIVFVQGGASALDSEFRENNLPEIRKIAQEMDVSVQVLDARDGAPPEVTLTPMVVYQNHLGRSIYQGRTHTYDRIRNFIRTSRFVPQGETRLKREAIPIWRMGRERVWAPLKVSAVTGTQPPDYDNDMFQAEALGAIEKGFTNFRTQETADLDRADRGFYMDFYPWLSQDGTLYLSLALYSQFHCKEPIFHTEEQPIVGPWKDRIKYFQQAAALMEAEVEKRIKDPLGGDGFDAVAENVPRKTWEEMGLSLPPAPEKTAARPPSDMKLSTHWQLALPGPADPPMIQFRFAPPLDQYRGEVLRGEGELILPESLNLEGSKGIIEIDTRASITMGEPVLDEAIRGSVMMNSKKFPTASFKIESVGSEGQAVAYGRLNLALINGVFTLKGKTIPLGFAAEVEPVIGNDGTPRLLIRGAFQIDLREFEIEGADGPAPANHTVLFDLNLIYSPKEDGTV